MDLYSVIWVCRCAEALNQVAIFYKHTHTHFLSLPAPAHLLLSHLQWWPWWFTFSWRWRTEQQSGDTVILILRLGMRTAPFLSNSLWEVHPPTCVQLNACWRTWTTCMSVHVDPEPWFSWILIGQNVPLLSWLCVDSFSVHVACIHRKRSCLIEYKVKSISLVQIFHLRDFICRSISMITNSPTARNAAQI